jgi:serine/threonine protein kinase
MTGFIAALKVIRKIDIDGLKKHEKDQMVNQLIREIKIQMFLDHPNLIKLYSYFQDEYNIYLLMELGCDGQLYDLMKKKPKYQ